MPTETFSDFIDLLEKNGELTRVKARVSPLLEIAEIADRMSKSPAPHGNSELDRNPAARLGGKALLFENVEGSDIPLAINTFGSYWRVNQALGTDNLEALAARVQQLVKPEIPTTLIEKMKKLPDLFKMAGYPPKSVKSGICQQVVYQGEAADLGLLPIIQCWPLDGDLRSGQVFDPAAAEKAAATQSGTGRYITLGGVHTRNPIDGSRNIGMYRVQVHGPRLAAMHWHMHHDGARHFRLWQKKGERMPLAVVLGGESVLTYSATAPLPPSVEELLFAGFLNGHGIELVKCKTIDLEVPANAEIVIEGYVDPKEKLMEGPFGDHTGFYSLADWYPAFHVTAITHRKNPIYPTTIVGKPPMEDYYLGKGTERIFLPLLKMLIPDIVDYSLPISGVFHNCAFIKIKKEYPYQARRVMHAIWGAGQMAFTKFIVVVDDHVNVHDEQDVLFHLFANCDPARDTEVVHGPVDILDHASPDLGAGSKMGFDATAKLPAEGRVRMWPAELEMDADERVGGEEVERIWASLTRSTDEPRRPEDTKGIQNGRMEKIRWRLHCAIFHLLSSILVFFFEPSRLRGSILPGVTMRRAVYAGSFDPITLGHLWMIEQGCALFDELIVAIGVHPDKRYLFTLEERMDMLRECTARFPNVKIASFENMFLVRYAEQAGASFILRGIRNEQDYGYERGMRYVNEELDAKVKSIFLIPPRELVEISSSFVKGLVGPDGWEQVLAKYVPEAVHRRFVLQQTRAMNENP